MDNQTTFAYIDESGNTDLDTQKNGASKYFIIVAIVVSPDKKEKLTSDIEKLKKKYFQTGEIKSSGVGNNTTRRTKILNAINELDFKFYALAVDKERISKDSGFQYKRSFLKNLNGKLFSLLFTSYLDIQIIADEHGSEEYKESFKKYIEKNHKPDMFYKAKFDLVNSKSEILVQLSDFIVGTLAKIYEKKSSPELDESYIKLISTKALDVSEWPTRYQAYFPKDVTLDDYHQLIHRHALGLADKYIYDNEKSKEEDTPIRVATLRHIVFTSRLIDKNKYVSGDSIIEYLQEAGHGKVTKYTLRSKIIAPLRDNGVIITSSSKGYKIPCDFNDMETFVNKVDSVVKPYISRLAGARRSLVIASKGEVDILKGPNFPHLVDFIDILDKYKN